MISVIIPVYNTIPEWIELSVSSILDQTFNDIEILLIDDASTNEDTIELLNKLDKKDKVEVIRLETNKGISGALNVGISNAKYDIIARMDSDDYALPNRFQKQFNYLMENPSVDLVGSNLSYMFMHEGNWALSDQSTMHPEVITKELAKSSLWFLNHPTVMFRKQSVIDVGGYNEALRGLAEDYELWIRMLRNGKELRNLSDVDLYLRINPNSLVQNINNDNHEFQLKLQESL